VLSIMLESRKRSLPSVLSRMILLAADNSLSATSNCQIIHTLA
jgi:hypothetical protein